MKTLSRWIFAALMLSALPAYALDPVAPVSERKFGMLFVKTPMPETDVITLTSTGGGKKQTAKPGIEVKVPIGDYQVSVKMQDYVYEQQVKVGGTERTEVVVPGYGNLKVSAPKGATIEVYKTGTQSLVAKFPASQVKVLPTGYYDVHIHFEKDSVTMNNVWIVTNTTREVAAKF
ncbi:MAG: hypothetical protein K8R69_05595 [Deltaproteobacteria bacterium]|nr:hypothetical protein [Deltaproteobacteria bacterium]